FSLFCTIGIASDMMEMGRQPTIRYVLTVLLISTFAMGYATAGTAMRGQSWKVIVPMCLVQFFLMNRLHMWFHSAPRLETMNAQQVTTLEDRIGWDGLGVMLAIFVGYTCFVFASVREGRRYFRAHAEIKLAQEIHQVLVPTIDMKLGEFEFCGRSSPSGEV